MSQATNEPVSVPVGTIVAFAADPDHQGNLPDNWKQCNGASFDKSNYPDLFKAIAYSNGGGGDVFLIPNLRGRFIRGQGVVLPGSVQDWATGEARNPITVTLYGIPNERTHILKGSAGDEVCVWQDGDWWKPCTGGDKESRPINTYLHYIIKILPWSGSGDDVPIGGVVPFAGADSTYPDIAQFVRCDGQPVLDSSVVKLATVVGNKFADPPQNGYFYPPDLTGRFIRGVDPAGTVDPDSGSRNSAPNGDKHGVGTWQGWATGIPNASVAIQYLTQSGHPSFPFAGTLNLKNDNYISDQTWAGGDVETRPSNAAVWHYISACEPTTGKQILPVGFIIAIPGAPTNLSDKWVLCDGAEYPIAKYPRLYETIQSTWGSNSSDAFYVPDLRGAFLRGAQKKAVSNGDPEFDKRKGLTPNSSTFGAGSYQDWATAIPTTGFRLDVSYPHDREENEMASSSGTYATSAYNGYSTTYGIQGVWENETRPRNVVVGFYIRAS